MKLQNDQIFSSTVHPQQSVSHNQHNLQNNSQTNDRQSNHYFNHHNSNKTNHQKKDTDNNLPLSAIQSTHNKKCYIIIGILSTLLLISIALNIYFGIKSNQHPSQDVTYKKIFMSYINNCNDYIYQVTIPNLSNKKILLNITHWPECYLSREFPKSASNDQSNQSNQQNQQNIPQTLSEPNSKLSDSDNLIWFQQHKIAIVAQAYNSQ